MTFKRIPVTGGWIWLLLAASLIVTTLPAQETEAAAEEPQERIQRNGERVSIFGDDIHVAANEDRRGVVVAVGADVVVEGHVRENVVVVFGNLRMTGSTDESVVSILSNAELSGARIGDQLINVMGRLERSDTEVDGQYVNVGFGEWLPNLPSPFGMLGVLLFWWRLFKLLLVFLVLLLLAALVPERIEVIAEEAPLRYGAAFLYGLLGYLGMLVAMTLLLATVIGFPIGLLIFGLLKLMGIAGIFLAFGRRFGRSLGREMSMLGAILLVFAPFALIHLLPAFLGVWGLILSAFIGFCVWVFLEVPALGLVILTRAGTRASAVPAQPFTGPQAPPATPVGAAPPGAPAPAPPQPSAQLSQTSPPEVPQTGSED